MTCINESGEVFEQHDFECAGAIERHGLRYAEIAYYCLNCNEEFTELEPLPPEEWDKEEVA